MRVILPGDRKPSITIYRSPITCLSTLHSRGTQSDVDDLRRRVDPDGKDVSNSIGHDHLAASARVESRPVAKQSGSKTKLTAKHELPAVRVADRKSVV